MIACDLGTRLRSETTLLYERTLYRSSEFYVLADARSNLRGRERELHCRYTPQEHMCMAPDLLARGVYKNSARPMYATDLDIIGRIELHVRDESICEVESKTYLQRTALDCFIGNTRQQ